jgi:predicted PurR-regulated permease PerM
MEKADIRKVWVTLITAICVLVISYVFGIPERLSGVNRKVDTLEQTKMSKDDANIFFNELQRLLASQTAKWDQYMISNEKDKERILKEIETIQEDIKQLIGKNRTVTRSVPQQQIQPGGKAINP